MFFCYSFVTAVHLCDSVMPKDVWYLVVIQRFVTYQLLKLCFQPSVCLVAFSTCMVIGGKQHAWDYRPVECHQHQS